MMAKGDRIEIRQKRRNGEERGRGRMIEGGEKVAWSNMQVPPLRCEILQLRFSHESLPCRQKGSLYLALQNWMWHSHNTMVRSTDSAGVVGRPSVPVIADPASKSRTVFRPPSRSSPVGRPACPHPCCLRALVGACGRRGRNARRPGQTTCCHACWICRQNIYPSLPNPKIKPNSCSTA